MSPRWSRASIVDHGRAHFGGVVFELTAGLAFDEREHGDGVTVTDPTQRIAFASRLGRAHERETSCAEGDGARERPRETVERRFTCVTERRLPIEIVNGDEDAASGGVGGDPVVTAETDRRVVERLDLEAPAKRQRLDQLSGLEPVGQFLHVIDDSRGCPSKVASRSTSSSSAFPGGGAPANQSIATRSFRIDHVPDTTPPTTATLAPRVTNCR